MACAHGFARTDSLVEGPEAFELTLDMESPDLSNVEVHTDPVQITINDGMNVLITGGVTCHATGYELWW